jgi:hypothetical protein
MEKIRVDMASGLCRDVIDDLTKPDVLLTGWRAYVISE